MFICMCILLNWKILCQSKNKQLFLHEQPRTILWFFQLSPRSLTFIVLQLMVNTQTMCHVRYIMSLHPNLYLESNKIEVFNFFVTWHVTTFKRIFLDASFQWLAYCIVTCQYSASTQQTVCWHVRSWACDIKSIFFRYSLIKRAETLQARCTINNPAKNKHLPMVHVSQSYDGSIGNNYQTCKILKPSVIRKYNKITFSVLTWVRPFFWLPVPQFWHRMLFVVPH